MTSVQMHLALTHVPVILSLAGLVMLVGAFFMKNNTLTKTSYIVLLISAITTLPAKAPKKPSKTCQEYQKLLLKDTKR